MSTNGNDQGNAEQDSSNSYYEGDDNSIVEDDLKVEITKMETRLVFRSRVFFFFFLVAIATVMGHLTHRISIDVEDMDFETRVSKTKVASGALQIGFLLKIM